MKKNKIYFYGLLLVFIVNTLFADNSLKVSIEKNKKQYEKLIVEEYIYLKNQADKVLFEPALDRCKDFAEKYFYERDNQVIIRNKLKKELFKDEKWEEYLFEVIHRLEIKSMALSENIINDAGIMRGEKGSLMLEFYVKVDGQKIKKEMSIDKVVKNIYERLGRNGANNVPTDEAERLFEKYSAKYKKTLLNAKYFSQLLNVVSPVIGVNPVKTALFGLVALITEYLYNSIDDKINDYRIHLRDAIIKTEENFNDKLRIITVDELEKVIDYYKNVNFEEFVLP